jgi:hypothetical protein
MPVVMLSINTIKADPCNLQDFFIAFLNSLLKNLITKHGDF